MSNYNKEYYESHKKAYAESNAKYLAKKHAEQKNKELHLIMKIDTEIVYKGFSLEEETYLRELLAERFNKLSRRMIRECNTDLDAQSADK